MMELSAMGYDVDRIHEEYPTVPRDMIAKVLKLLTESKIMRVAH